MLGDLPKELVIQIADHLDFKETNALCRTNGEIHDFLSYYLYYRDLTRSAGSGRSLLWAASKLGIPRSTRKSTTQRALHAGRSLKLIPDSYYDALQFAADGGHACLVELLLEVDGINPNFAGKAFHESPPLVLAADKGHSDIVKLLLAATNIDPNVRGQHSLSPFLYASSLTKPEHGSIMNQLLARDDVLELSEFDPSRALLTACHSLFGEEFANLLLANKHGSISNVNLQDFDGYTPLMLAIRTRKESVVESLLARGDLKPNIVNPNLCGDHVLLMAARRGNITIMKLLLGHPDIDLNFVTVDGYSALTMACLSGVPNMLEFLLSREGIATSINQQDVKGLTPLCYAAKSGDVKAVELLLQRDDIGLNIPDNLGWTALFWACESGCPLVVDLLLNEDDIDLNVRDNNGRTPLAYACLHPYTASGPIDFSHLSRAPYGLDDFVDIVRLLLSHADTDPNPVDIQGVSLLSDIKNPYYREGPSAYRWGSPDQKTNLVSYARTIESLLRAAGAS
ncbi:Ankyrin repeat-containing domain protein [Elaphomyces granulatus]|jgi:ankyrin repeat protein